MPNERTIEFEFHPAYLDELRERFDDIDESVRDALVWASQALKSAKSSQQVLEAFPNPADWLTHFRAHVACETFRMQPGSHLVCEALCSHLTTGRPSTGSRYQLAKSYSDMAVVARQSNDLERAVRLAKAGLELIKDLPARVISANLWFNLATALEHQTQFSESKKAFSESARLDDALGRSDKAQEAREKAASLDILISLNPNQLSVFFRLAGQKLRQSGDMMGALAQYKLSLHAAIRTDDTEAQAATRTDIAGVFFHQAQYEEASTMLSDVVKELGARISPRLAAGVLSALGAAHAALKRLPEALRSFEQSRNLATDCDDKLEEATCCHGIGEVYGQMHRLDEAHAHLLRALEIRRELGEPIRLANTLNELGVLAFNQRKLREAEAYFQESLNVRRKVGDKRGIGESYDNLAAVVEEIDREAK